MDSSNRIRSAIAKVFELRTIARSNAALNAAVSEVKQMQSLRFGGAYADLLQSVDFQEPCQFFLEELYGIRDFSERDAQFSRIAGSLATIFPASVVRTAVEIAELHALTESLDHQVASSWLRLYMAGGPLSAADYVAAWRNVGQRSDREHQLRSVLTLGNQLSELTRKPGLSTLLKMMRRPAAAAGLSSLQEFLESGFSIFGKMARTKNKTTEFLSEIQMRESSWIEAMFDEPPSTQAQTLSQLVAVKKTRPIV